jgi:gluconolactonase
MRLISRSLLTLTLTALPLSPILAQTANQTAAQPAEGPHAALAAIAPGTEILRLDPALDALIAPGTHIERVADGFQFTEGPMWRQGRLWVSDEVTDTIYAVSPNGTVEPLLTQAGGYHNPPPGAQLGPNGMVTDKDGTVLLAQQGGRKLVRILTVDGHLKEIPFIDGLNGKMLNSPNDLVFAPNGTLWFTDPPYGLALGDKDPRKELPFNAVYRYTAGRPIPVIKNLPLPNGIGLSPDGKILYISNSGPDMCVMRYDVRPDNTLSAGTKLIDYPHPSGPGVPDGLKIDSAGNLWSTAPGGIRIITPEGKIIGHIKLPHTASNLAFAGDGRTLYITAQSTLYRLRLLIPGELPLYRK